MSNRKLRSQNERVTKGKRIVTPGADSVENQQQPPLFCLQYIQQGYFISNCNQEEKAALATTLLQLSQMSWAQITMAPHHGAGIEKIARNSIKAPIPKHITEDINLIALRFYGRAPLVGYRSGRILHIVWLDRAFTLYDHG